MTNEKSTFLLSKYFNIGWLEKCYYDGRCYRQPYSAYDRLCAGKMLYNDFLVWRKGARLIRDYDAVKVDVSFVKGKEIGVGFASERFRCALKCISRTSMPVVYKIVLSEEEIKAPLKMSTREKLYFNDEIKGLLCRGLDELVSFYRDKHISFEQL